MTTTTDPSATPVPLSYAVPSTTSTLPLAGRAMAAYVTLGIAAVANLACFGAFLSQRALLEEAASGMGIAPGVAAANDQRLQFLSIVQVGTWIVALVLLLMWFYRAYWNLRAAGQETDSTPGWAVGYWFIPIISWWKPYQGMKELWLKSGTQGAVGIVGIWWFVWLIDMVVSRFMARSRGADDIDSLQRLTTTLLASELLSLVNCLLLLWIVRSITRAQQPAPG